MPRAGDEGLREHVAAEQARCSRLRTEAEAAARSLILSAMQPAAPVLYFLLRNLPDIVHTVELPCQHITIAADVLQQAAWPRSEVPVQMAVGAALQATHAHHFLPRTKVSSSCINERSCVVMLSLAISWLSDDVALWHFIL